MTHHIPNSGSLASRPEPGGHAIGFARFVEGKLTPQVVCQRLVGPFHGQLQRVACGPNSVGEPARFGVRGGQRAERFRPFAAREAHGILGVTNRFCAISRSPCGGGGQQPGKTAFGRRAIGPKVDRAAGTAATAASNRPLDISARARLSCITGLSASVSAVWYSAIASSKRPPAAKANPRALCASGTFGLMSNA